MIIDRYVTTEEVCHFRLDVNEGYVKFFNNIYRNKTKNWVDFTYDEFVDAYCGRGEKKANFSDSEWEGIVDTIHSWIDEDLNDNFDDIISCEDKSIEDEVTF